MRLKLMAGLVMAAILLVHIPQALRVQAGSFGSVAFERTWTRTDALVANGRLARSFYWGPNPGLATYEDYAQGVGGKRLVQYFDKSRMEINNPTADPANPFYVTNGLLTVELISGQMQVGDNEFLYRYPANIDLASDPDDANAPTYASFRGLLLDNADTTGATENEYIARDGTVGNDPRYATYKVTDTHYEAATKHNIPDVFWAFLNQTGPVMVGGKQSIARLSDPYFYATGYPIAEPYWASVKIAGQANTDVLIQPYERRVLTYVPSAPQGFKVQMGNIGQHYYDWRYNNAGH